jgi:hypothetical protein
MERVIMSALVCNIKVSGMDDFCAIGDAIEPSRIIRLRPSCFDYLLGQKKKKYTLYVRDDSAGLTILLLKR